MSFAYAIQAISPAAASSKPHILGFATARTAANDLLLDIWNGSASAARVFSVDKDGDLAAGGAAFSGAVAIATTLAVAGITTLSGNVLFTPAAGLIAADTLDTADSKAISLAGGGAASGDRGGYVAVFGNEHATNPGDVYLVAGTGGEINLQGNVVTSLIRRDTTDTADNDSLVLAGGGASADTRGAVIQLFGNEHATGTGQLRLTAGNIADGHIQFNTGGAERFRATFGGDLVLTLQDIYRANDVSFTRIAGGNAAGGGGDLTVYGGAHATLPGAVILNGAVLVGHSVIASVGSGHVALTTGNPLRSSNIAGNNTFTLIQGGDIGGTDVIQLGASAPVAVGAPGSVVGAAGGELVVANSKWLRGANAGGTAARGMILMDAADILRIGVTRTAAAVPGNFAANTYIRLRDENGNDCFIPAMAASW